MLDRYARDSLACYGRLRQLDPAQARAELEILDDLLVTGGRPRQAHRSIRSPSAAPPNPALGST